MLRSLYTASNTMGQLQTKLDVLGNNIANVNTAGFKKRETTFTDLLYQEFDNLPTKGKTDPLPYDKGERLTPDGVRRGVGAKIAETNVIMSQGPILTTGRDLDVSFTKPNQFFRVVVNENGQDAIRYTRNGNMYLHPTEANPSKLELITSDGNRVVDSKNKPIVVDEGFTGVSFSKEGVLSVTYPNGKAEQQAELAVTNVRRPQMLTSVGDNLYDVAKFGNQAVNRNDIVTDMTGNMRKQIGLHQGGLEQSNVDLGTEMGDMIVTQRSYQFNAKAITTADQMMGLINGFRG